MDDLRLVSRSALDLADKDHLTGLYNRRFFDARLSHLAGQCERDGQPLCVLTLDVDYFKRINDRFGHPAGDTVLREIAHRIEDNVRAGDVACRVGGEEFIVIMPATDLERARRVAERLLRHLSKPSIKLDPGNKRVKITVSVGVSCHDQLTESLDELLQRADQALYEAKAKGRNRVVCGAA